MNVLKGPFFLKVASLVFALACYFYIHREAELARNAMPDPSYRLLKPIAKRLPVKLRLETSPPDGYRILQDRVSVDPDRLIVIGPEAMLEEVSSVETSIVDMGDAKSSLVKKVPVESVAGIHLSGDPYFVTVTIPIEKIESPAASASPPVSPSP